MLEGPVPEMTSHNWKLGLGETTFSECSPGPEASVSPENLLEMHILWSHPSPSESESLGVGPKNLCLKKPSR